MSRKAIAVVLIIVLVLAAAVVLANGKKTRAGAGPRYVRPPAAAAGAPTGEPCVGMGMGMGGRFWQRIGEQLNLTPAQVNTIKQLHQQFLTQTASARQEMQSRMVEMKQLWMAEPPDAAAIKNLANEMEPLRAQIRDASIDFAIAAMNVLTPDQRAKLRTIMQSHPMFARALGMGMFGGMGMCPGKGGGAVPPSGAGPGAGMVGPCPMCK